MSQTRGAAETRGVDVTGRSDGQPVVFVHGVLFTRALWAPQREALSDEFRVVVPDLPGHGEFAAETFRMEPALDRLETVIESAADGRASLVGISLGGYVATEFARRHPEMVDALVVSGSSVNPTDSFEVLARAVSAVSRLATKSDLVDRGVRGLAERWVNRRDLPPKTKAEILDSGIFPRQFGEAGFELAGRDFREAIAAYPGPTLVLNGRWDLLNRLGERDHAAATSDADLVVLNGAGHVCNLERPERYADEIRRVLRAAA